MSAGELITEEKKEDSVDRQKASTAWLNLCLVLIAPLAGMPFSAQSVCVFIRPAPQSIRVPQRKHT